MPADSWDRLPDRGAVAPDQRTEHREIFEALRRAIDQDLRRHLDRPRHR